MKSKILIVDDNPLEIEYLKKNVDWEELEFEICATAYNGRRGLLMYDKFHPDLIIMDIQMPGMTGIEMARTLRERQEDVYIVFLSSYEVFEYARSGFELGVAQYILKQDIGTEKVQNTLRKVKEQLAERKKLIFHRQRQRLRRILEGTEEEIEGKEISEVFTLAVLFCDGSLPFFPFEEIEEEKRADFSEMEDELQESGILELPYTLQETILIWKETAMLSQREQERRARETCKTILKKLIQSRKNKIEDEKEKQGAGQIRICLIGTGLKETQIREQYLKWKPYFNQRFLIETGRIFTVETRKMISSEKKEENGAFFIKKEGNDTEEIDWKVVDLYQKQRETDSFFNYVSQCIENMIQERQINQIFRSFSVLFSKYEEKWKNTKRKQMMQEDWKEVFPKEEMSSCDTIQKAVIFWKERYSALEQEEEKSEEMGYSRLTRAVISYIQGHYREKGLDTNQIAQYVSLSSSRLRFVFKEEVGQTIGQYLTEVRMQKAKRLLLETKKSSDEIADEIGYLDGKYFRKMFKQKYGLTPREFREREKN